MACAVARWNFLYAPLGRSLTLDDVFRNGSFGREQPGHVLVLALNGAKVHGEGMNCGQSGPGGLDVDLPARRYDTKGFNGQANNPGINRVLHRGAVITDKLDHDPPREFQMTEL